MFSFENSKQIKLNWLVGDGRTKDGTAMVSSAKTVSGQNVRMSTKLVGTSQKRCKATGNKIRADVVNVLNKIFEKYLQVLRSLPRNFKQSKWHRLS